MTKKTFILFVIIATTLITFGNCVLPNESSEPKEGWTTSALVTRVIDGDTIEVEIRRTFAVRLVDPRGKFNVAERNTVKGQQAKSFLESTISDNEVKLFISAGPSNIKLMDINSFNRLLGEIWFNGNRLTDILMENGYGKLEE